MSQQFFNGNEPWLNGVDIRVIVAHISPNASDSGERVCLSLIEKLRRDGNEAIPTTVDRVCWGYSSAARFNRQRPSEIVMDGEAGWLVNSSQELLVVALEYCRRGLRGKLRKACRERARRLIMRESLSGALFSKEDLKDASRLAKNTRTQFF